MRQITNKDYLIYIYKYLQMLVYEMTFKHKKPNRQELLIIIDRLKDIINDF